MYLLVEHNNNYFFCSLQTQIGDRFNSIGGKDLLWSSNTVQFQKNEHPVHQYLGKEYECNMAAYQTGFPGVDCMQEA